MDGGAAPQSDRCDLQYGPAYMAVDMPREAPDKLCEKLRVRIAEVLTLSVGAEPASGIARLAVAECRLRYTTVQEWVPVVLRAALRRQRVAVGALGRQCQFLYTQRLLGKSDAEIAELLSLNLDNLPELESRCTAALLRQLGGLT